MNKDILSFLGLALRGRRAAVGEEPAALAARAGESRLLLLAADAGAGTLRRGERLAEEGHCMLLVLPFTKAELGGALGRGSVAILAVTDTGFAAALVKKLAAQDPERYAEAAARMERKVQRAKERKTAPPREKKRPGRPEGGKPRYDGERRDGPPTRSRNGGPRGPGNGYRGGSGKGSGSGYKGGSGKGYRSGSGSGQPPGRKGSGPYAGSGPKGGGYRDARDKGSQKRKGAAPPGSRSRGGGH